MRVAVPVLSALVLLLLGISSIGCGGSEGGGEQPVEAQAGTSLGEAEESRALELFQSEACAACHGEMGGGVEGAGPALGSLAPYWSVERLMNYLEDPKSFRAANPDFENRRDEVFELEMPAYDHLSRDQRRLLARWLLSR